MENLPVDLIKSKTVLIVSDSYPPSAKGGAEISLHAVLSQLPQHRISSVLVVIFDPLVSEPKVEKVDGVDVLQMPTAAPWPHWHLPQKKHQKRLNQFPLRSSLAYDIVYGAQHALSTTKPIAKAKLLLDSLTMKPKGGILTDDVWDSNNYEVSALIQIVRLMEPSVLLCDNTRSIMSGAAALEALDHTLASIAIVRDNRFHCSRHSQSQLVNGKICRSCSFNCAAEDNSGQPLRQKNMLKATANARRTALQRFDHVVVTSHHLARYVGPLLAKSQKLSRIPNTFGSQELIQTYTRGVAKNWHQDLMIVGMLNENKGQLEFLRHAVPWLRDRKSSRLVFCGQGVRIERTMRNLAKKEEIEKQVRFLGFRSRQNIFEIMRESTLVLSPTVWPEPFGRIPLEAGIARRAIVAFAVGGLNETIVHGKTGLLVRPGDYSSFFSAIDHLLTEGSLRNQMEKEAYLHVSAKYGPASTVKPLLELIEASLPNDTMHGRPSRPL